MRRHRVFHFGWLFAHNIQDATVAPSKPGRSTPAVSHVYTHSSSTCGRIRGGRGSGRRYRALGSRPGARDGGPSSLPKGPSRHKFYDKIVIQEKGWYTR